MFEVLKFTSSTPLGGTWFYKGAVKKCLKDGLKLNYSDELRFSFPIRSNVLNIGRKGD